MKKFEDELEMLVHNYRYEYDISNSTSTEILSRIHFKITSEHYIFELIAVWKDVCIKRLSLHIYSNEMFPALMETHYRHECNNNLVFDLIAQKFDEND